MDIRQVKYFIEIINSQSYSLAAKNLFVTQPTLSWNMTKLQNDLGTKLLYQVGNKVLPTSAGELLYEKGSSIVQDFDQLEATLLNQAYREDEELVIGSNAVISPFFMPLIEQFMTEYPHISLHIVEEGSIKTQKKVSEGDLEIGIVSYPINFPNLSVEKNMFHSFHYDAYVVMRSDHSLAKEKSLKFSELKEQAFVSMSKDFVLYHVLQDLAEESGFRPNVRFISNNHEVVLQTILNSQADQTVALMPIQLQDEYLNENLTWVKLDNKVKKFDIVVIHEKNRTLSPIAAQFLEFVTSHKIKK